MIKFCKKCQLDTMRNNYGQCKPCNRERAAKWRAANPEKSRARALAWKAANPERAKASEAAWRKANPERGGERAAKWRSNNPEKAIAYDAAWYAANAEKKKAYTVGWYAANPEAKRIYAHNRRARKRASGGTLSKGLSNKLFKLQKGRCACCNKPLGDDFHLDHIMPIARGGSNTDENIQLLRASCNQRKSVKDPIEFMQQKGFLL